MSASKLELNAAVLRTNDGPFELEPVTVDPPGPGEVLVRIAGVGLCHTDQLLRTPLVELPVIAGHEAAGLVESVGPGVTEVEAGDHVVLSFDSCAGCPSCLAAAPSYCETFWQRNLTGYRVDRTTNATDAGGAPVGGRWFGQSSFATHSVVAARNTVRVDPTLPLELLGPLSCGFLTGAGAVLNSLAVEPGSTIVVFGAGAVGLAAVMAARLAGAGTIVAVERSAERLALAAELGATDAVDGASDELAAELRRIMPRGAEHVLDTTGSPVVIARAIDLLRPGGSCGLLGSVLSDLTVAPAQLSRGVTLRSIVLGDAVPRLLIPTLIELWQQGRFPFDRLIETFPLERINDAQAAAREGAVVKPVLVPGAAA